jgi:release factor glutamine methyltransferase
MQKLLDIMPTVTPWEVKGKFDLIVFNPPYVPTEKLETLDMQSIAWQGGKDGREVIDRFLAEVFNYLKPNGKILLLISSHNKMMRELQKNYGAKLVSEKKLFYEKLFVLEITNNNNG